MTTSFDLTAPYPSSINLILERIAALQMTISVTELDQPTVLYACAYPPTDISALQIPFFVNKLRGGPSDPYASTQYRSEKIDMYLGLLRKEGAENNSLGTLLTAEWVDAVYAKFGAHIRLSEPTHSVPDIQSVLDSYIESWDDEIEITYGSSVYLGLKFTLSVQEMFAQVLAA